MPPPDAGADVRGHLCEAEAPTEAAKPPWPPLTRGLAKPQVLTEGEKEANNKNNSPSIIKTTAHHI